MRPELWERILSQEVYRDINFCQCERVEQVVKYELLQDKIEKIYFLFQQEESYYSFKLPDVDFGNFYRFFIKVAIRYSEISDIGSVLDNKWVALNVLKGTLKIPIRCLITDINRCRTEGLLQGNSKEQQYVAYEGRILGKPIEIKRICQKYPEMLRLLLLRIVQVVDELSNILHAAETDKKSIEEKILIDTNWRKIQDIQLGMSDVHAGGKTVAQLLLDNGQKIIYKPRNSKKDLIYHEIYSYLCSGTDIKIHNKETLDFDDYSWEEYLQRKECSTEAEVQSFFYRVGIQLFICYITSASDIHGENLIANGEYPEFIDLEVLPGNIGRFSENPSDDEFIKAFLTKSVMHTGILPQFIWGDQKDGCIISALHSDENYKTSFKVPVILNSKTSEISLSYTYGEISLRGSLPLYQGEIVSVQKYINEVTAGFCFAYKKTMKNNSVLKEKIKPLFAEKSRYLIRHTQQYGMYTNTSLEPEFLTETINRIYLLHILKQKRMGDKTYNMLFPYELKAMTNLEIPIYYFKGNSTTLYSGNGDAYPDFFEKTAMELFEEKNANMSIEDLERQVMLIRLSILCNLPQVTDKKFEFIEEQENQNYSEANMIHSIATLILKLTLNNQNNKVWFTLKFYEQSWKIEPANMSFYEGISGLAVFFVAVSKQLSTLRYKEICLDLCTIIFSYTEDILLGKRRPTKTGMFEGEGSIVFTYILLYQLSKEKKFLEYAKKHVVIVESLISEDTDLDLLSGNAGWIVVLIKLYRISLEKTYLEMAVKVGEDLWTKAIQAPVGYGWLCAHQEIPIAGMAHGNSGFILAYTYLLDSTGDFKYVERIVKLLDYEDSLYSETESNWRDLRQAGNRGKATNAWCHGGTGILLSRLKLYQMQEFANSERIRIDIERGIQCIRRKDTDNLCLCHGLSGRYVIMKACNSILHMTALEEEQELLRQDLIRMDKIPVQELYSPSLMAGILGSGLALCDIACEILW